MCVSSANKEKSNSLQGYTDEPISKILTSMGEAEPVMLDRWELQVEKNPDAPPSADDSGNQHPSRDTLPLSVVNNYFSFGVDAQIALDFHEARGKPQSNSNFTLLSNC